MTTLLNLLRYLAVFCAIGAVISGGIAVIDGEVEIPSIPLAIGFDF
jgi:hypothetical protein